jgi:hypothetical protein
MRKSLPEDILRLGLFLGAFSGLIAVIVLVFGRLDPGIGKEGKAERSHQDPYK